MSSSLKNLSEYTSAKISVPKSIRFGIVVAEWHSEITEKLCEGAIATLLKHGVKKKNIFRANVPGSFELPYGAQLLALREKADALICIGCVIKGETSHADYICNAVAHGLIDLSIQYKKPFVFGVLTPDNMQQAKDRAGGKHGNKGVEAAVTAMRMVMLSTKNKK